MYRDSFNVNCHVRDDSELEVRAYVDKLESDPYLVLIIGDVTFFIHDVSQVEQLSSKLWPALSLAVAQFQAEHLVKPPVSV